MPYPHPLQAFFTLPTPVPTPVQSRNPGPRDRTRVAERTFLRAQQPGKQRRSGGWRAKEAQFSLTARAAQVKGWLGLCGVACGALAGGGKGKHGEPMRIRVRANRKKIISEKKEKAVATDRRPLFHSPAACVDSRSSAIPTSLCLIVCRPPPEPSSSFITSRPTSACAHLLSRTLASHAGLHRHFLPYYQLQESIFDTTSSCSLAIPTSLRLSPFGRPISSTPTRTIHHLSA